EQCDRLGEIHAATAADSDDDLRLEARNFRQAILEARQGNIGLRAVENPCRNAGLGQIASRAWNIGSRPSRASVHTSARDPNFAAVAARAARCPEPKTIEAG